MKIKHQHPTLSLFAITALAIISSPMTTLAQETSEVTAPKKKELEPDSSELLKKGNTWTYDMSVQFPEGITIESSLKDKVTKTKNGTLYKYEEIHQSSGLALVEPLERKAPYINIFINGELTKKQILEYREGSLLYYGTYNHDPKNPDIKKGVISKAPILLYKEDSEVAAKWSWSATGFPEFQFRVIGKNQKIEVRGTKYITDKVQMDQLQDGTKKITQSKEIWFAKDIGVVREIERSYIGDDQAIIKTRELKSFSNNPLK